MTSITLNVCGAKIQAAVNGPLTSGMVGIPVNIRYDGSWNGLTKNLVCRCGKWGPDKGENRTVLNVGETATVAHEVMKADINLYLGLEGRSVDGRLVIPTQWADCGRILPGANAGADPSGDPKSSVWGQIQTMIGDLVKLDTREKDNLVVAINEIANTRNGSSVDLDGYVKTVNGKNLMKTVMWKSQFPEAVL